MAFTGYHRTTPVDAQAVTPAHGTSHAAANGTADAAPLYNVLTLLFEHHQLHTYSLIVESFLICNLFYCLQHLHCERGNIIHKCF